MTRNRLKVLYYYLFNQSDNVTLPRLINYFFALPYSCKAKLIIKSREIENNSIKFNLSGYEDKPIYYPKEFSLKSFEQVIVESFYKNNWHYYEIEQTKVEKNDFVIDCGAAEGLFSFIVANRCREIYTIEPLNKFVESLSLTFRNVANVHVIEKALSDHEYKSFISTHDISSLMNDEKDGEEVTVTTLDKLFLEKDIPISYIKMDLEGYDYLALKGGAKLIEKYTPKIAVTTYHSVNHFVQIKKLLLDINPNYKILTKGIYHETGCPIMLHAWM